MAKTPEQRLDGLIPPSPAEAMALARRNRQTSELLDGFVAHIVGTAPTEEIFLNKPVEDINPDLPDEFVDFLRAFLPQATSINYRLSVSRECPKLSLMIARGMEDVASVNVWNKTPEIGVAIKNNWSGIAQIGETQMKLERMLQGDNGHINLVNHLYLGQQIIRLAINARQGQ
jgi:hypothetical protein